MGVSPFASKTTRPSTKRSGTSIASPYCRIASVAAKTQRAFDDVRITRTAVQGRKRSRGIVAVTGDVGLRNSKSGCGCCSAGWMAVPPYNFLAPVSDPRSAVPETRVSKCGTVNNRTSLLLLETVFI